MINTAQKNVNLHDVATIFAGYPLRGSADALSVGNVSFVQIRNIAPNTGVNWNSVAKVSLLTQKFSNWLENGDILFTARGSNNYALALNKLPKKTVCAPQFFVLRIKNKDLITPDFLAWQINQRPAQDYFKKTAVGSRLLNIRRPALESLKIAIPSLRKQNLIVNMWKAGIAEQKVMQHLIQTRNKQLEAIAFSLFQNEGTKSNV